MKHAIELDKANGNMLWQDAMALEGEVLKKMDCFEFKDDLPGNGSQQTTLHMVRLQARPLLEGQVGCRRTLGGPP
eukprot:5233138-Ditylum_brightwellii.AAC.1